jgi:hypothetical protein
MAEYCDKKNKEPGGRVTLKKLQGIPIAALPDLTSLFL